MPMVTAPSMWLRTASGLRMRPASITETTRLTRSRAISGCHVTSTKCTPNEWLENFGFAAPYVPWEMPRPDTVWRLPIRRKSSNGSPVESGSPLRCTRPLMYWRSEARPANFEPGALAANASRASVALPAASRTAGTAAEVTIDPPELIRSCDQTLLQMPRGKGNVQPFIDFWLVDETQLDRIHVELQRQLVHRRFRCVKPRNRTWPAHGGGRAHIAPRQGGSDAQVGHAVQVRRSLAAVFLVVVQDRR